MAESNLRREIYEQPEVLGRLLRQGGGLISDIARRVRERAPRFALIAARGTSDNAATYGKYVLGALNGLVVGLAAPSLFTVYRKSLNLSDALVIGVSQSGQGLDVNAVLEQARAQGALTLAITNSPGSPMTQVADEVIELGAGPEKSVAASKTYTCELLALAMFAAYWNAQAELRKDLEGLERWVDKVLGEEEAVRRCAEAFGQAGAMVIVSRGYNHPTSYETALKIKELAYVSAQAYSAADFRHGPIAILDEGFPVLAFAPQGEALADMMAVAEEIKATGARLAVVSNEVSVLALTDLQIRLPGRLPEWLSPIACAIPGQFLALYMALERGRDPDQPRGLQKVTRTR
jgi:glucosamine--fructose-6-phosphate aminotransferase (isomerizing)